MYQVGMYGGSFNPLHLGHIRCIVKAAAMCEELNIIICDGRARNEVDIKVRYRWVYQATTHLPRVRLHVLEDYCSTKEEYGQELWEADAERIKTMIGRPVDVVFCGNDYDGNSFYASCYPESEIIYFERDDISSTAIRKDIYGHWDWLPGVVRPYYVKKVLLLGGESTGKSTMTVQLANYYNTNYIDEAGRELSMRSGDDRLMLMEDYTEILLTQKMNELKAAQTSNRLLFIDTDCIITRFYMEFLNGSTPGREENMELADAINGVNRYDLILFLEPDVEFVQDGTRSEEIRAGREKYSCRIKELLNERNLKFHCIHGDYSRRLEQIVVLVDELLSTAD